MAKPFSELRERLLRAGVAPRHVRRYLAELGDHLADLRAEEEAAGHSRADAESAAIVRLGGTDELAKAMIEQRHYQSWCALAPWATFGVAPVCLLAGAWFVACFILWSGWKIFMPGTASPFGATAGPVYGIENIYFQTGRMIYFGAPILVGWGIGLIAARQRLKAIWPFAGLALIALIGGTGQVHTDRPFVPGEAGRVSMVFNLGNSVHGIPNGLVNALALLTLMVLPYLIWRLQKARSVSA